MKRKNKQKLEMKMNEYQEAQTFKINQEEQQVGKNDISLDFHSLKKEQSLVFSRRGSHTSITSQVTSKSQFKSSTSKPNLNLPKEDLKDPKIKSFK